MPSTSDRVDSRIGPVALAALAVTAAVLGAGVLMTGSADARGPPQPACAVCSDDLDDAAAEYNVPIDRGDSRLTITVHPNGTSTWLATVDLNDGADELANGSLRAAIVESAVTGRSDLDVTGIRSRLNDGTLVVTYRSSAAVSRSGSVLVFDGFRTDGGGLLAAGGEGPWYVGADRLTMVGPQEYVIRADPARGEFDLGAGAIQWTGNPDTDARTTLTGAGRPAFVPEQATFPGVRARLARLVTG
jgi:hypothetical protein